MRRTINLFTLALVAAVALFALQAIAQTRAESWDATAITTEAIHLFPLPDGGCAAMWCGSVVGDAGTVLRDCTDVVQLKAAVNQNRCNGLLGAGQARLQRALNFDVDAGAP